LIHCVSTFEHIGRDNEVYAIDAERDEHGDEAALRELHRVLAKDGRLLVSVPTGVHDDQGWQVQRDPLAWIHLFERTGYTVYEDELYVRGADGWRTATLVEANVATTTSAAPHGRLGESRKSGSGIATIANEASLSRSTFCVSCCAVSAPSSAPTPNAPKRKPSTCASAS